MMTAHWKKIVMIAGIVLIALGASVVLYFSIGVFNAYREVRFAHQHHFDSSNPDTSAVRPWMSIRYVSIAYHIPEEYLFRQTGIPMTQQNSLFPFRILSGRFGSGSTIGLPALLERVRTAIDGYKNGAATPPPANE